jgi:general nucleoside transport system ATP-binding protein
LENGLVRPRRHDAKIESERGMGVTVVLELSRIRKTFGEFVALDDVGIELQQGEVHALLGENGAGKSTLMNIAAGLYTPDAGACSINGEEVHLSGPREARSRGVVMVQQHFQLVRTCSVVENVLLANPTAHYRSGLQEAAAKIRDLATELGFEIDPWAQIHALSLAEQQRVEILKVLIAGARVIILDEPTAVLADAEADRLLDMLRVLTKRGAVVVLVTHKLREVTRTADRVTIMRGGRKVGTFPAKEVSPSAMAKMIVGSDVMISVRESRKAGEDILNIVSLKCARADGHETVNSVSLHVRSYEIFGIAGVSGNGQSELMDVLMGIRPPLAGSIEVVGLGELSSIPPHRRRDGGISFIPADRYRHALASGLSVQDNYVIGQVGSGKYGSLAQMNFGAMKNDTMAALSEYDVLGVRSLRQKAALLSGGNAQKLVLARELRNRPRVVIAHNPSRGLDVRATAAVQQRLLAARDEGAAVVLISEDLDEIMQMSDRIGVLARGRIVAEFESPADRHAIGQAMTGHA